MRDKLQLGILAIITICGLFWACVYEHTYTMSATVYAIDENIVTFADCTDCFWQYDGAEDLHVGDTVTVKFNDHYTMSNRCDDIVVSFKKR